MGKRLRYGDYLGAVRLRQRVISYNDVTAFDATHRRRVRLRPVDVYRLLAPYISTRFIDQLKAVAPIALFLALFQIFVLQTPILEAGTVAGGLLAVMMGLMLFIEGVKQGLMPFSETIGYKMPASSPLSLVLAVAFILGVAATFAEPAIGGLKAAGSLVGEKEAPHLYQLLHYRSDWLVLAVGLGVGLAVLLGILRFVRGWSLKTLLLLTLPVCLGLTGYMALDPALAPFLGLAWDCGAITTGPVTVPLVLAVGIGVAAAVGEEDNPLSGFGIVTLASLFPAIAVMLLGLFVAYGELPAALPLSVASAAPAWYEVSPYVEVVAALRAILPLTLFLWLVQRGILREKLSQPKIIAYGIVLAVLGMLSFNIGLDYGLNALGTQSGKLLPAAFSAFVAIPNSPLYPYEMGIALVLLFAALIGFGATIAEPALNAMGITVQNLTDGAFRKELLIRAVAVGVAMGTALGVVKVLFDLPIAMLLLPSYSLALLMTVFSGEEYVNLAWDSAGVTTGPVTVPLVLAMGLGLGEAVKAQDGFGILAMASVGPIVSVLAVGMWINLRAAINVRRDTSKD